MRVFMAGAASTGLSAASSVDVARSSAMPCAILAMMSAVAGATTTMSASCPSRMWAMSLSSVSASVSLKTVWPANVSTESGGDERGAGPRQDAAHLGAVLPEPPDEVEALVGGDAAGDHQQHPLAAEQRGRRGLAVVSRVRHGDTLRARRNRRKRAGGAARGGFA